MNLHRLLTAVELVAENAELPPELGHVDRLEAAELLADDAPTSWRKVSVKRLTRSASALASDRESSGMRGERTPPAP